MYEFKGFDDWVPIFQGGKQTDSSGREHDGDALIEKSLAKFNAAKHEPPACIGHPAHDAPAYGWVEGLKKVVHKGGNLLLAKFKQVEPNFEGMVKAGRFKKRSAAFYPDGSLRHVAFLGAAPPAVKGLPDMAFSEEADAVFEFAENNWKWEQMGHVLRSLREWLIDKFDQDTADRVVSQWAIDDIRAAPPEAAAEEIQPQPALYAEKEDNMAGVKDKLAALFQEFLGKIPDDQAAAAGGAVGGGTFTEADLAAAKKQAADDAAKAEREKVAAEFAEKERVALLAARKGEISVWCDKMVAEGKLTPAIVKFGLPQFMEALAEKSETITFGEGDGKTEATLFDRFKGLFETVMPKVVNFGEIATRDKDTGDGKGKKDELITKFMEQNKDADYKAAVLAVSKDHPELFREEE